MKQSVKKFIAAGGLVTSILLANPSLSSAQYLDTMDAESDVPVRSYRHEKRFEDKLTLFAAKAGIDPDAVHADSRKTVRQILKDHGVSNKDLHRIMGNKRVKR
jgi:hypothetical protein